MAKQTLTALQLVITAALLISMGSVEASSQVQSRTQSQIRQSHTQAISKRTQSKIKPNSGRVYYPVTSRYSRSQYNSKKTSSARDSYSNGTASSTKYAYYKRAETLSQTASLRPKDLGDEKIVSASLSLAHSQSMIDQKDGSQKISRSVLARIDTKISSQWNLTTRFTYEQDLRDVEDPNGGFSDLSFGLGKAPAELAYWLKGGMSFSLVLPTSEYSQKAQNLQASIGAGYRFALTPAVLAKGFEFGLALGVSRNFHQYETDTSGNILNQYGSRETLSGSYSIQDWTFSTDLIFRHAWNYRGRVSQAFEHSQEIGYAITPMWSLALGHTNSGAWLRPNGQDSNFKLIDENDSIIYGSTTVSF